MEQNIYMGMCIWSSSKGLHLDANVMENIKIIIQATHLVDGHAIIVVHNAKMGKSGTSVTIKIHPE